MTASKNDVRDYWDEAACGENLYLDDRNIEGFRKQADIRYELEPYIAPFADFAAARGKKVLEIGVGLGADHQRFAEAGAILHGVDLTPRAIELTRRRFELLGLSTELRQGDAENLDFADASFDIVYSWGVIHHSPDTPRAVREIYRVLKPGGVAKVMIYQKYSLVGFMLWLRYALFTGHPLTSLADIYSRYLESPGTKAYSVAEARVLFLDYEDVSITSVLGHGDLLTSRAGQRHEGTALNIARRIWPRWFFKRFAKDRGLTLMVHARKPAV
jgi:SAM-dependent methyltransferase